MPAGMSERAPARAWGAGLFSARGLLTVLWSLALLLPMLWQLGGTPLFDADEGAFSEATREMIAHDDYGHTTLNGAPRFDKPIGIYWLQAASVSVFGLNEFALRLPSALGCWGMALALAAFARRRWGDPAGLLAGLLAVTSIGFQVIGRVSTADGCLNFLLVLAGLDAWRFAESGSRAALRRAYAWVALGLLVKGPVALVVPGAAFCLWCATSRRRDLLRQALLDLPGWALLVLIAAPWYAYALHRDGMDFANGFLMKHNVDRFTGTIGGHAGTPLYYLVMLPLLAMPWAPALVAVVARARSLWREPVARYLLGWGGFVLVFFSLSATKLPHYVLYGYAPLVLLMARASAQAGRTLRIALACSLVAWAAIVGAVPWIVLRIAATVRDPLYHALLAGAAAPNWLPALLAALLVIALVAWPARSETAWLRAAAAGGALALLIASWSLPWFGATLQGPIRRAAAVAAAHGGDVAQWHMHWPSFSVYLQRETPVRDPLPDELALTRTDRIPPEGRSRPRLFEERGVVLLGPAR